MSQKERALVRHTGDKQSVEKAEKREQDLARILNEDILTLLELPAGRRVLWRIIEHCKVFNTIWDPSSRIHYNSGKQDVGHFVLTLIMDVKPAAFTLMMEEHNAAAKELEHDA